MLKNNEIFLKQLPYVLWHNVTSRFLRNVSETPLHPQFFKHFGISHHLLDKLWAEIHRTVFCCVGSFNENDLSTFSSPSYYVWGTLVIVQIFDFRFLADLHVLGVLENPKNTKISMMSKCSLVS